MPAPLAMPSRFTADFPERKVAQASLGRVSVVMMARAKSAIPCLVAARAAISSGNVETIFSTGRGTPMMPVEDGKISLALHSQKPGQFPANLLAGSNSGLAGGAVGIAGIHDYGPHPSAAGRQRRASDLERSGDHAIFREHGCRGRARTGLDQRQIRPAAGLDSGAGRRES